MPTTRRRHANPPDQPENNNHHLTNQAGNAAESVNSTQRTTPPPLEGENMTAPTSASPEMVRPENLPDQPIVPSPVLPTIANGDRSTRQEHTPIESGRRTAHGELFRRPPQPPPLQQTLPPLPPATLQPPSHEIKLPLGEKSGDTAGDPLHLAYNPGYTGAEAVRSALLHKLASESKQGGRARCWNCGSLAILYECWSTRNKNFGEVGIAFCEICGVWSVM